MATERELRQVAVYDTTETGPSAASLLGGIVGDVQQLVRTEIALARTETLEELSKAKTAGIALGIAGAVLALGGLLILLGLAGGLADLLNVPEWAGYGIFGLLLGLAGLILLLGGKKRIQQIHPLPEKTVQTVKENVAWLKQRTTGTS